MRLNNKVMTNNGRSVVVCATVRDSAESLQRIVDLVRESFGSFDQIHWLFVESDSRDRTLEQLDSLQRTVPNFRFVSLGELEKRLPKRTERIAYCRNVYRRIVAWSPRYFGVNYVAVLDADHVNFGLTRKAVDSAFSRGDWDACFANQFGKYYDLYALRHEYWNSADMLSAARFFSGVTGQDLRTATKTMFAHRMIDLSPDLPWISVSSAFGGLGLYKRWLFRVSRYRGQVDGQSVCEHVPFHRGLNVLKRRLFINPALLNGDAPEHWLDGA